MCLPALAGAIGGALGATGASAATVGYSYMAMTGLSAASGAMEAAQNRRLYAAQAAQAEDAAKQLDFKALEAEASGAQDSVSFGYKVGQERGQLRTGLAASGVELTSGTAAQLQNDLTRFSREDMARLEHGAALSAWGFRAEAQQQRSQAKQLRRAVKDSRPLAAVGKTLLGAALQVGIPMAVGHLGKVPPKGIDTSMLGSDPKMFSYGGKP